MSGVSRREFLKILGAGIVGLAVGAGAGYALSKGRAREYAPAEGTRETTTTPTTTTQAPTATTAPGAKIRALWVYVGPIGDYGWTHAHHIGKEKVDAKFGWLETKYLESVEETKAYMAIKNELQTDEYQAVFATSYGFMDAVKRLASEYPEIQFYHCSGPWEEFKDLPNVTTYFAEFY